MANTVEQTIHCYHCGEEADTIITAHDKHFCCEGCRSVYEILNKSGMCDYYDLSANPGVSQRVKVREDKFAFLDDKTIGASLLSFRDEEQSHITFYLPQIHCSSCLWLLENLHKLDGGVISGKVNFPRKEVDVIFSNHEISLRKVAELLTRIGYEPYISLNNLDRKKKFYDRSKIFKLGVAGFCFANIMLLSFPEYLGIDHMEESMLQVFRFINLFLSLPVFFYSATEFYSSAWKGLKHRFLNIDAPIVLAVFVTFGRSIYEVLANTGGGYFDSMAGIVFFMLVGRVLQDKTYRQLSFERDYTSYFPVAVTRIQDEKEEIVSLPDIRLDDTLLIHNQELVPADGIITRGNALIDYSFVTGESLPVEKAMGEIVYAGGKQVNGAIEILVIKEVSQSYLTRLWNKEQQHQAVDSERSFVHSLARYFTVILFTIALGAAAYWYFNDPSRAWDAVTAVLIVACPCALLLCNTFTNGNILRILGNHRLYLRNAQAIEDIANVDHIVFDKTGTLTTGRYQDVDYSGKLLPEQLRVSIASLVSQSTHPMSKAILRWLNKTERRPVKDFKEVPGKGLQGRVDQYEIRLGSGLFISGAPAVGNAQSEVHLSVNEELMGVFSFRNHYRDEIPELLKTLQRKYPLTILSGDNAGEKRYLRGLLGKGPGIFFNQSPEAKLYAIKDLQAHGRKVMMIGDGLNDAGALRQADVGIAISEESNSFTPASDGILGADKLKFLDRFIQLCKTNRRIVMFAFVISVIYNIVGLSFAVQGTLSPLIAAILMPASSLTILLITFGISNLLAVKLRSQQG
ncbi:MAG: copper-translocating P-type ATPase [Chitinophagaceae bacterium]|nr:copper-translocating P-type ATPase [Chitinophagaceae bacterium]